MFNEYSIESIDLLNPNAVSEVHLFLVSQGLKYEPADITFVLRKADGKIVGTGSVSGYVIKCLAIDLSYREGSAFSEIVSRLLEFLDSRMIHHSFVFTKPDAVKSFINLGFKEVEKSDSAALLELGGSIDSYKRYLRENQVRDSENAGAVIVNCNPFSLGHRYLIEQAASQCDCLYVIVVEEDRSVFPFKKRYELVQNGTADLHNVRVLRGDRYVVSASTFPSYFLKCDQPDEIMRHQADLDVSIFARHLAPALKIKKRFVGTEDYCATTAAYNAAMEKILPGYGIELTIIPRKKTADGRVMSASSIRAALRFGDLSTVKKMVPETTFKFLISPEAKEIIQKIKKSAGRH